MRAQLCRSSTNESAVMDHFAKELARKYFSQLSLDTVKKLYDIYKVDFEMFGYSPRLYYGYAKNGADV